MAGPDKQLRSQRLSSEDQEIPDQGGSRSGNDRRQNPEPFEGSERRTGRDRRRGFDRRSGIERREGRYFRDGELVERRDVFRRRSGEK
jgi:hypothetical protein